VHDETVSYRSDGKGQAATKHLHLKPPRRGTTAFHLAARNCDPLEIMSKRSWLLDHGWRVRQADGDGEWLRVSKVPTNIHVDLLAAKKYAALTSL